MVLTVGPHSMVANTLKLVPANTREYRKLLGRQTNIHTYSQQRTQKDYWLVCWCSFTPAPPRPHLLLPIGA